MLTNPRLVLAQADAIARLARLRVCAQPRVTPQGHLNMELPSIEARHWVKETIGHLSSNVARVLRWEEENQLTA